MRYNFFGIFYDRVLGKDPPNPDSFKIRIFGWRKIVNSFLAKQIQLFLL